MEESAVYLAIESDALAEELTEKLEALGYSSQRGLPSPPFSRVDSKGIPVFLQMPPDADLDAIHAQYDAPLVLILAGDTLDAASFRDCRFHAPMLAPPIEDRHLCCALALARQDYSLRAALAERDRALEAALEAQTRTAEVIADFEQRLEVFSDMLASYSYDFEFLPGGEVRCKRMTKGFEALFGYAIEEFASFDDWLSRIHMEDRPRFADHAGLLREGKSDIVDIRAITKTGTWLWIRNYVRPYMDSSGTHALGFNGAGRDITQEKVLEQALRRRDAILEAVAQVAATLLESATWRSCIGDVLRMLGAAAEVSRADIFDCHLGAEGKKLYGKRFEWVAPGSPSHLESPGYQDLPLEDTPFKSWGEAFERGELVMGCRQDFSMDIELFMELMGICSVLAVPIFTGSELWGFVSFDDCVSFRTWHSTEIDALRTASAIIGAAIHRERADIALRSSSKTLFTLLNAIPESAYLLDRSGVVIQANDEVCRRLGVFIEEMIGRSIYEFYFPEVVPERRRHIQNAVYTGLPERFLDVHVGRHLDTIVSPVLDDRGHVSQLAVVSFDITEHKQVLDALRRRELILKTVANMAVNFLMLDTGGTGLSEILEQLGEVSHADSVYVYDNIFDYDGQPAARLRCEWNARAPIGEVGPFEETARIWHGKNYAIWAEHLRKGEPIQSIVNDFSAPHIERGMFDTIISTTLIPIFVGGEWWGFAGFDCWDRSRDWMSSELDALTTAAAIIGAGIFRRRTLDELRRTQEWFELALQGADLGMWDWDLRNNLVAVDQRAAQILSYTAEEAATTRFNIIETCHPEDYPAARARFETHIRGGTAHFETAFRLRNALGNYTWVQCRGQVVEYDSEGRPIRMTGTCVDLTERKRAEAEETLRREQLVRADKMISLGILVAGVAHEINNPNHYVMTNISLLRHAWKGILPLLEHYYEESGDFSVAGKNYSEIREEFPLIFDRIEKGAKRIRAIVQELRDFSREQPPEMKEPVQLNLVVESALTLVANMLKKATHRFSVNYDEELPPVLGNFQRLEQVIINLVQNACQALSTPDAGVFVRTWFDAETREVVLEVKDEGQGLAEEMVHHVTDPFFTTKRESGGTGLGLAISSRIIMEHGGRFEFSSAENAGATASVILPAYSNE